MGGTALKGGSLSELPKSSFFNEILIRNRSFGRCFFFSVFGVLKFNRWTKKAYDQSCYPRVIFVRSRFGSLSQHSLIMTQDEWNANESTVSWASQQMVRVFFVRSRFGSATSKLEENCSKTSWIPAVCEAHNVVDPWHIQSKTVVCREESNH